jgi:TonB family protein
MSPTLALVLTSSLFTPPRLREGLLPERAAPHTGGGEVWLELTVSETGSVTEVRTLRATPPFADSLRDRVSGWRFEPAREDRAATAARVLVVGIFRPPTLLGPAAGEAPHDEAAASPEVPIPVEPRWPPYPPRALGDATVLVEATIAEDGSASRVRGRLGKQPFSAAAVDGVRGWRFKPASRDGKAVAATVVVVVGFRSPVSTTPRR